MKKTLKMITLLLCGGFCFYLCTRFSQVAESAKNALSTGVNVLIPSLFPFFVISDLLVDILCDTGGKIPLIYKKLFKMPKSTFGVFVSGIISGYPVGAKASYDLYEKSVISKSDAEDLICFTNNSGPLFIICAIGCGMLKSMQAGVMLYVIHILGAFITGMMIARSRKATAKEIYANDKRDKFNLAYAIEKGFMQSIKVVGFVVFFGIVTDMIVDISQIFGIFETPIGAIMLSALEMTNGIVKTARLFDTETAMCIISFACGFSGVSVYFQTALVTKGMLDLKKYVVYKLFNGIICMCICKCSLLIKDMDFACAEYYKTDIVYMVCLGVCYTMFTYYLFKMKTSQK